MIRVSSQKGGVGKSVMAVNLAVALQDLGNKVLLIDSDFVNPSVGEYLGLPEVERGYEQVVTKGIKPQSLIVRHAPSGVDVVPHPEVNARIRLSKRQVDDAIKRFRKLDYDFIIMDTQPGIPPPESVRSYDEALIVALPYRIAFTSAYRLSKEYERARVKHNLIVNRVGGEKTEMSVQDMEQTYGKRAIGTLPEDPKVRDGVAQHTPVYIFAPRTPFSVSTAALAAKYSRATTPLRSRAQMTVAEGRDGGSLFGRLWSAIRGMFGM